MFLKPLKETIENLFGDFFRTDDPTAYNCEVFLHKETGELIVLNAKGEIEANKENLYLSDVEKCKYDKEGNKITFYLNREKLEYLGEL